MVSVTGLGDQYQVILDKPWEQDKLKVRIEVPTRSSEQSRPIF